MAETEAKVDPEVTESDKIRTALGNTYTFVRSREFNKTVIGYTFDHYIDAAMRSIKDSSSSTSNLVVTRIPQMDLLVSLEASFSDALDQLKKKVEAESQQSEESTS
jgi:hypothetical protein